MNPEDLQAFGEVVKTHVEPIKQAVSDLHEGQSVIQTTQSKHGERLARVETEVKNKGNCTEHAEKVSAATEQAKSALKNTDKNWTFIRVLTIGAITSLIGIIGSLLVWRLELL
jgi:cation transport ATPase